MFTNHGYIAYVQSKHQFWLVLQSSIQSDFLTCDNSHRLIRLLVRQPRNTNSLGTGWMFVPSHSLHLIDFWREKFFYTWPMSPLSTTFPKPPTQQTLLTIHYVGDHSTVGLQGCVCRAGLWVEIWIVSSSSLSEQMCTLLVYIPEAISGK